MINVESNGYCFLRIEWNKMRCAHNSGAHASRDLRRRKLSATVHLCNCSPRLPASATYHVQYSANWHVRHLHKDLLSENLQGFWRSALERLSFHNDAQFKSQFEHKERSILLEMSSCKERHHQEGGHLTAINA